MRYAARADENQSEIVEACRKMGASVKSLHREGEGCPDLLIGWYGQNLLFEIKNGAKMSSQSRLTKDQEEWHQRWKGNVYIVISVDQAIKTLRAVREEVFKETGCNLF